MPENTPPFDFDLDRLPPLLRISDICRDPARRYAGLLPMSRSAFLAAIVDGYIAPPLKLGAKAVAWRREDILRIIQEGVPGRRALARETKRRAAAEGTTVNP